MATKTCKRCKGSGRMPEPSSHDKTAACVTCDATGKAADCPDCAGKGQLGEGPEATACPTCAGFGQVPQRAKAAAEAEGE